MATINVVPSFKQLKTIIHKAPDEGKNTKYGRHEILLLLISCFRIFVLS